LSSSPQSPEAAVTFFLDRTHQSKHTVRLLKSLGVPVEVHQTHFEPEAPDDEWIPVCAAKGWVILTGDQGIEKDGLNRASVIQSGAKVFTLICYKAQSLEMTAALIAARKKIARTAADNVGPFYCRIEMLGDSHVSPPKFYPGGYALEKEKTAESSIEVPKHQEKKAKQPSQSVSNRLDFGDDI
jgi:hypothetical protein